MMPLTFIRKFSFVVCIAGFVAACSVGQKPFVYRSGEFDRTRYDFGQKPTDVTTATICYSSRNATPADVLALANEECATFRKKAVFVKQELNECPLLAPTSAVFECVADHGGGYRSGTSTPGSHATSPQDRPFRIIGTFR